MSRYILKNKNFITLLSFTLIVLGFSFHFIFDLTNISELFLIIASIIGVIPIAIQAYQSLRVKVISIDLLVTIAVIGAFIIKNYEESSIVTFLFLFGSYLEKKTMMKTRSAIKELTKLAPSTAFKQMNDNEFVEVDIDDVSVGDILLVKTGDSVPVDGKVIFGSGYTNESSLTGESDVVNKQVDSNVFAGTILENGTIQILSEKVGEDTTFGKIIELVEEAQDAKSKTQKFIDNFSKYYTPFILLLALVVYLTLKDVEIAITVLVLGCPGALVIGVPVSSVAGIGNGARHGVILKGSEIISTFSKVDTMVFDKTGTLTIGKPKVTFIKEYGKEINAKDYLYSIEKESTHPLAAAITANLANSKTFEVLETEVIKGFGIKSIVDTKEILIGNPKLFINNNISFTDEQNNEISNLEELGNSVVVVSINKKIELILGIKDEVRVGLKEELLVLRKQGIKEFVILSGDNQKTVDLTAKQLGIKKAFGNMLPDDKQKYITNLQNEGKVVAFVGDGVNDSPSIASSNIGISMGSGTDVAIETSDVVLVNSSFKNLTHAYSLAKSTNRNMKQNVFIAIFVVIVLLVGLLASNLVSMSIGMLVHEASILVVILNGMRLLRFGKGKRK